MILIKKYYLVIISLCQSVDMSLNITKCKLLDWEGSKDAVAERRRSSSDHKSTCSSYYYWTKAHENFGKCCKKHEKYLWQITPCMTHIEAVGSVVGWPADWVVIDPTNRLLCYSNIDEVEIVFFCIIFAFVIYDTLCFIVNHHFFLYWISIFKL